MVIQSTSCTYKIRSTLVSQVAEILSPLPDIRFIAGTWSAKYSYCRTYGGAYMIIYATPRFAMRISRTIYWYQIYFATRRKIDTPSMTLCTTLHFSNVQYEPTYHISLHFISQVARIYIYFIFKEYVTVTYISQHLINVSYFVQEF